MEEGPKYHIGIPYFMGQIEGGIMLLVTRACVWFLGGFGGT